jgi:uncharacterized protein DUF6156
MKILIWLISIVLLIVLILLMVVAGIVLTGIVLRWFRARRKHDPIEYFGGWDGYSHPITLTNRITKEEADAIAARGNAYLIGYYDADGKLTRVIKMLRGEVFFDYAYAYHPNGRRKSATVSRNGRLTVLEYDERGRGKLGRVAF